MLTFDPHRWLTEYREAQHPSCEAGVAIVAAMRGEDAKPIARKRPATVATVATLGGDPSSPFYVLDDEDGWIGESPVQTRARLGLGTRSTGKLPGQSIFLHFEHEED